MDQDERGAVRGARRGREQTVGPAPTEAKSTGDQEEDRRATKRIKKEIRHAGSVITIAGQVQQAKPTNIQK